MTPSFLIKLSGLILVAWATLGSCPLSTQPFGILCGLLLLMAFLDAGQAAQAVSPSKDGSVAMGVFFGKLVSLSGAPFYVALMVFAFIGMSGKGVSATGVARPTMASTSMCGAEGGGCGSSGGCGTGGCGASSGGACGCSSGKKSTKSTVSSSPKAPTKKLTEAELKQRTDIVQQRVMATAPAGSSDLPGIGPNGRPLPVGLVPKPGVALPPGVVPTATSAERSLSPPQQVASPTPSNPAAKVEATSPAAPVVDSKTTEPPVLPTTPSIPTVGSGAPQP